jgi:hypothetical protein
MLALIEGHPNIDVIIFYILASAVLTVTLYRHHKKDGLASRRKAH